MSEIAMMFLGIDPGFCGALAVVNSQGHVMMLDDTPTLRLGSRREYDREAIKQLLRTATIPVPGAVLVACVELVHAMPGQGVVSMWRMGQGFELWMMALTMLDVAVETVTPQRWKGVMLDGMPKKKDASRYRAQQLWPKWADQFNRKKDDGRADACLIAEYLRRQWVKT